jgi:uncharacterized membrane protein YhaH (DUF805 family)
MSKPVFEDMFALKGVRRNRKSYIFGLGLLLLGCLLYIFQMLLFSTFEGDLLFAIGFFLMPVFLMFAAYVLVALTSQRIRDIGRSGWFSVIVLFPYGVPIFLQCLPLLVLCVLPGAKGENKYGADPLGKSEK